MEIILASASPRRQELLKLIVEKFRIIPSDIDENVILSKFNEPQSVAREIAKAKAKAVALQYPNNIVIGCDTVVEIDGKILGKPLNKAQAKEMLKSLSGKRHKVHTGVCIISFEGQQDEIKETAYTETTDVLFLKIPDIDIEKYISTEDPYDKAGAYSIQGWAAKYAYRIEGCYYNVMGLPVASLASALAGVA